MRFESGGGRIIDHSPRDEEVKFLRFGVLLGGIGSIGG